MSKMNRLVEFAALAIGRLQVIEPLAEVFHVMIAIDEGLITQLVRHKNFQGVGVRIEVSSRELDVNGAAKWMDLADSRIEMALIDLQEKYEELHAQGLRKKAQPRGNNRRNRGGV